MCSKLSQKRKILPLHLERTEKIVDLLGVGGFAPPLSGNVSTGDVACVTEQAVEICWTQVRHLVRSIRFHTR